MFELKSKGKTISEAIENGIKVLGVSKEKVKIKVLRDAKKFNDAIVAIKVKENEIKNKEDVINLQNQEFLHKNVMDRAIEFANTKILYAKKEQTLTQEEINGLCKEFVIEMLKITGLKKLETEVFEDKEHINLNIFGNRLSKMVGYNGKTLASIQYLVNIFASTLSRNVKHIVVDFNGYKKAHTEKLEKFANKKAKQVLESGKSLTLKPMNAFERRVVHNVIIGFNGLKTESIGEEPNRRVVISLNQ